jgi:hypothetical protein
MFWQLRSTGTKSPVGVATATEISTKLRLTISVPSMTELTAGNSKRAIVAALRKKLIKPSLTLCLFKKSSPSSYIREEVPVLSFGLPACPLPGKW